jgi:hypothetical protein
MIAGITFATLLALTSWAWAGPPPQVREAQTAQTEQGRRKGIHIDRVDRSGDEKLSWIRILVHSDTPIKETWSILQDVEHWDRITKLFTRIDLLEAGDHENRYKLHVSPPWPLANYYSIMRVRLGREANRFEYWIDEGYMYGTFGAVSGGQDGEGCWLLFENFGSPERRFPDWMTKISVYLAMPSVLKDVRNRALEVAKEHGQRKPKTPDLAPGEGSGTAVPPETPGGAPPSSQTPIALQPSAPGP